MEKINKNTLGLVISDQVVCFERLKMSWEEASTDVKKAFMVFVIGDLTYADHATVINAWEVRSKINSQTYWPFSDLSGCIIRGDVEGRIHAQTDILPKIIRRRFILDACTYRIFRLGTISPAYQMFLKRTKMPAMNQHAPFGAFWTQSNT